MSEFYTNRFLAIYVLKCDHSLTVGFSDNNKRQKMEKYSVVTSDNPEIVIGFVGAVGTDLAAVTKSLSDVLGSMNYTFDEIRLSSIIRDIPKYSELNKLANSTEDIRIDAHMDAGDDLRSSCQRGDILALLATQKIANCRSTNNAAKAPRPRHAYILNSLKHPDEVKTLRDVYGSLFLLISIYSPKNARIESLAKKIASTHFQGTDATPYKSKAEQLVLKDSKSNIEEFGQNVSDTFPLADVFIRMGSRDSMKEELDRALSTWFQHPFRTPSTDEYGIFLAEAASLRSSDLARQVGAVAISPQGDILTSGYNEVPKPGGGLYSDEDSGNDGEDDREFKSGTDTTVRVKAELIGELVKRLQDNNWLSDSKNNENIPDLVEDLLFGSSSHILKGTRVASIIEFGRIIHAEMAAIMDAARRGISLKGATLYCTTYPCHMCARHIIAAGINRVVFIEPYPKSMAKELYGKSIIVEGEINPSNNNSQSVIFESFVGIAPQRYGEFFSMPKRKDKKGQAVSWNAHNSSPKIQHNVFAYISSEIGCGRWITDNEKIVGLKLARNRRMWSYKPKGNKYGK